MNMLGPKNQYSPPVQDHVQLFLLQGKRLQPLAPMNLELLKVSRAL